MSTVWITGPQSSVVLAVQPVKQTPLPKEATSDLLFGTVWTGTAGDARAALPLMFEFIPGKKVMITLSNDQAVGSYTVNGPNVLITFPDSPVRYAGVVNKESMFGSLWNPNKSAFALTKKSGPGMDSAGIIGRFSAPSGTGSGTLVDQKQRLVLTNAHVVGDMGPMMVHFSARENGALLRDAAVYRKLPGIPAKVVLREDRADIALLQLESLPETAEAIAISSNPARSGQEVWHLGNPSAASKLWVMATGQIGRRSRGQWNVIDERNRLRKFDALRIDTPTSLSGDSGGPLVNEQGELVGVAQGSNISAPGTSLFIDISECRALLDKHYGSLGESVAGRAQPAKGDSGAQLSVLVKDLDSKDAAARLRSVQALGKLGPEASISFTRLFQLLKDDDLVLRRAAADALEKIPPHKADGRMLLQAFRDNNEIAEVRLHALKSAGRLGLTPEARDISFLEKALQLPDPDVRRLAADGLGTLGPSAKPALSSLLASFKMPDSVTRAAVIRAIGAIGPDAQKAIPALRNAMTDKNGEVSMCAAGALIQVGDAKSAIPHLTKVLKNPGSDLRKKACMALGGVGADANGVEGKSALNELIRALADSEIHADAAEALVRIGKPAAEAISKQMTKTVRDDKARLACVEIVGRVGYPSRNVVAALRVICANDPQPENREAASRVMEKLLKKN